MSYGIDTDDSTIVRARNRKEFSELAAKAYDFEPLKDGEKITFVVPAFDFRGGEDGDYGQHYAELIFAKRKGSRVVSVTFYTGWSVDGKVAEMDGRNIGLLCTGLFTHYRLKKDAGKYASKIEDCPFTGGRCYGELGSSLYGDVILTRLINEGSPGVWDEIDKELA